MHICKHKYIHACEDANIMCCFVSGFFLESKHFQLVLEEGGRFFRLQIFEGQILYEISFFGHECSSLVDV